MRKTSDSPEVLVSDVMTSQVRTASPHQGLRAIWTLLADEHCHHVPIVDDGRPVGMISARDLVRVARRHGADRVQEALDIGKTAGEIMSTELVTIRSDESIDVAIDRIGRGDIHALIVLDHDQKLVGIVTHRDLLHFLMS